MASIAKATKLRIGSVTVLWMDDEPKHPMYLKRFIDAERETFQIDIETSVRIDDARRQLETGEYAALVVDCMMDPHDFSESGAAFLREVSVTHRGLPIFVYSAHLDDPANEGLLDDVSVIAAASKMDPGLVPPLSKTEFFRQLNESAVRFEAVKNCYPERIRFLEYLEQPDRYAEEVASHWVKHGAWIAKEMKRRSWVWCVVVGDRVLKGSADLTDYPSDDDLMAIGRQYDRIPFAYGGIFGPEEAGALGHAPSAWNATCFDSDWYPTVRVRIGATAVRGDLDTGAYCSFVPAELVSKGLLNFSRPIDDWHMGKKFRYFVRKVPVEVEDGAGTRIVRQMAIAVVEDWHGSGFTEINRNRVCLIGRDLLRVFELVVVLDSRNRSTAIRHLQVERIECPFVSRTADAQICSLSIDRQPEE